MGPLRFMAAGNFPHMVSYPAWHHCVSTSAGNFYESVKISFLFGIIG